MENNRAANFKLYWAVNRHGVVHSDPSGQIKSYYIYPPHCQDNYTDKFELILLEDNFNYDYRETTYHDNLESAQKYAQLHFNDIIESQKTGS